MMQTAFAAADRQSVLHSLAKRWGDQRKNGQKQKKGAENSAHLG